MGARLMGFGLGLVLVAAAGAQQNLVQPAPGGIMPPALPAPLAPAMLAETVATLNDQPATHSGVVFDRNMMQIAQGVLEQGGLDARRAAAALTGISFDSFHYQQPAFYSPEGMQGLIAQYRAAGWKHLVNANATPGESAQPRKMITDLWLHFDGGDVDGVTILTRATRQMNVIQIRGDLRPLELVHLSGHFGIPKVDPDAVMVPERSR